MTVPPPLPPGGPAAPHPDVPVLVTVVPMRGSLIGATDSEGGHVFVRADATMAEIGAAILAGVHEVAAAWYPPAGVEAAPVIPLPRTTDDQEEVRRGLG